MHIYAMILILGYITDVNEFHSQTDPHSPLLVSEFCPMSLSQCRSVVLLYIYIYIYIHFFGRTQIQPSAEELRAVVQAIRRGPFCVSELFPLRSRYWAHLSLRRVLPFFLHTHAMSWSNQTGHVLRARERERERERGRERGRKQSLGM